jgi:hypothetical protein
MGLVKIASVKVVLYFRVLMNFYPYFTPEWREVVVTATRYGLDGPGIETQ